MTTIAAADRVERQVGERYAAERATLVVVAEAAEPVGDRAPRRRAARETSAVSSPGGTTKPGARSVERRRRRVGAWARAGVGELGLDAEHGTMRRAATRPRVNLSAASVAVRSGMTRNAA